MRKLIVNIRNGYKQFRVNLPIDLVRKLGFEKHEHIEFHEIDINGEKGILIMPKKQLRFKNDSK